MIARSKIIFKNEAKAKADIAVNFGLKPDEINMVNEDAGFWYFLPKNGLSGAQNEVSKMASFGIDSAQSFTDFFKGRMFIPEPIGIPVIHQNQINGPGISKNILTDSPTIEKPNTTSLMDRFTKGNKLSGANAVVDASKLVLLKGDLGKFLGEVERYEFFMVLRGDPGAGKSRFTYRVINAMLNAGYDNVAYNTLEIGKNSKLVRNMANEYMEPKNLAKTYFNDELNSIQELHEVAKRFQIVVIDSWGKIPKAKPSDVDELRKAHPNTAFIIIVQSNAKGTTHGGKAIEFDGGMVFHVVNAGHMEKNYIKTEKNRYTKDKYLYNNYLNRIVSDEYGNLME